jgi:CCR4-NOT transcriptional regulation complex NOT5 subunit
MITREQALCLKHGQVIKQVRTYGPDYIVKHDSNMRMYKHYLNETELAKPINWRVNGQVKTWKTRPDEFKLPIKHGLYSYAYLDHTNNHLFEL